MVLIAFPFTTVREIVSKLKIINVHTILLDIPDVELVKFIRQNINLPVFDDIINKLDNTTWERWLKLREKRIKDETSTVFNFDNVVIKTETTDDDDDGEVHIHLFSDFMDEVENLKSDVAESHPPESDLETEVKQESEKVSSDHSEKQRDTQTSAPKTPMDHVSAKTLSKCSKEAAYSASESESDPLTCASIGTQFKCTPPDSGLDTLQKTSSSKPSHPPNQGLESPTEFVSIGTQFKCTPEKLSPDSGLGSLHGSVSPKSIHPQDPGARLKCALKMPSFSPHSDRLQDSVSPKYIHPEDPGTQLKRAPKMPSFSSESDSPQDSVSIKPFHPPELGFDDNIRSSDLGLDTSSESLAEETTFKSVSEEISSHSPDSGLDSCKDSVSPETVHPPVSDFNTTKSECSPPKCVSTGTQFKSVENIKTVDQDFKAADSIKSKMSTKLPPPVAMETDLILPQSKNNPPECGIDSSSLVGTPFDVPDGIKTEVSTDFSPVAMDTGLVTSQSENDPLDLGLDSTSKYVSIGTQSGCSINRNEQSTSWHLPVGIESLPVARESPVVARQKEKIKRSNPWPLPVAMEPPQVAMEVIPVALHTVAPRPQSNPWHLPVTMESPVAVESNMVTMQTETPRALSPVLLESLEQNDSQVINKRLSCKRLLPESVQNIETRVSKRSKSDVLNLKSTSEIKRLRNSRKSARVKNHLRGTSGGDSLSLIAKSGASIEENATCKHIERGKRIPVIIRDCRTSDRKNAQKTGINDRTGGGQLRLAANDAIQNVVQQYKIKKVLEKITIPGCRGDGVMSISGRRGDGVITENQNNERSNSSLKVRVSQISSSVVPKSGKILSVAMAAKNGDKKSHEVVNDNNDIDKYVSDLLKSREATAVVYKKDGKIALRGIDGGDVSNIVPLGKTVVDPQLYKKLKSTFLSEKTTEEIFENKWKDH